MAKQTIEAYRNRRYVRLMNRLDADDDDGQWITTENGHKVHISAEGEPDMGNAHVLAAMTGGKTNSKQSDPVRKKGSGNAGAARTSKYVSNRAVGSIDAGREKLDALVKEVRGLKGNQYGSFLELSNQKDVYDKTIGFFSIANSCVSANNRKAFNENFSDLVARYKDIKNEKEQSDAYLRSNPKAVRNVTDRCFEMVDEVAEKWGLLKGAVGKKQTTKAAKVPYGDEFVVLANPNERDGGHRAHCKIAKELPQKENRWSNGYSKVGTYSHNGVTYEVFHDEDDHSGSADRYYALPKGDEPRPNRIYHEGSVASIKSGNDYAKKLKSLIGDDITSDLHGGKFGKMCDDAPVGTTFIVKESNRWHDTRSQYKKTGNGKWEQTYAYPENGKAGSWKATVTNSDIWNALNDNDGFEVDLNVSGH